LEPLTERERQVLSYLPSHFSLRQIGKAMHLSTNTVKTHVKSIYRKTGAICRDDSVSIARAHGLV
jgi:LuxR family maltose regulon positive regulatory protein